MKRVLALSLAAASSMAVADSNNRTYLAARPHLANMPVAMGTFFSHANQDNPGFGGAFQATAFFEQSTDRAKAGKYFSFTDKNSFKIQAGAPAVALNQAAADADALPGNFALDTAYNGVITYSPQRTSYGVHLNYQQDLTNLCENLYFTVAAPVVAIEHTMGLKEDRTAGALSFKDNMAGGRLTSDFSERMRYALIGNRQRVVGVADVEAALGYRFFQNDRFRVQGKVTATVPTGGDVTGQRMFEAVVGNGGHWGLGLGLAGRANVWQHADNEDQRFSVWLSADAKYLFQDTETRTVGFKDKDKAGAQFARMRQQDTTGVNTLPGVASVVLANSVPGVNAMTRALKVTPGFQAEGMLYADYTWNAWKIGAGYNIFGRQAESVSLKNAWDAQGTYGLTAELITLGNHGGPVQGANFIPTTAINAAPNGVVVNGTDGAAGAIQLGRAAAGSRIVHNNTSYVAIPQQISAGPAAVAALANTVAGGVAGGVQSTSTIKTNANNGGAGVTDGKFITASDLDLQANKSAVSHKLAGQISYALNTDNPSYLGLGGGYEFAGSNDLLSNWQIWAKFGISF